MTKSKNRKTIPLHPGKEIKEKIDELGLSLRKAAMVIHVSNVALTDVVNEEAELTEEMALKLEQAFGFDA